jgi:hypothetical protein
MYKWLVVAVLMCSMVLMCSAAFSESLSERLFDPARWSVSAVQAIDDNGTGACASYRVVDVDAFHAWIDAGVIQQNSHTDPFIGGSTNIPPIDRFLKSGLNLETSWGYGYLFLAKEGFAYGKAGYKF